MKGTGKGKPVPHPQIKTPRGWTFLEGTFIQWPHFSLGCQTTRLYWGNTVLICGTPSNSLTPCPRTWARSLPPFWRKVPPDGLGHGQFSGQGQCRGHGNVAQFLASVCGSVPGDAVLHPDLPLTEGGASWSRRMQGCVDSRTLETLSAH